MKKIRYVLLNPTGNLTGLVLDPVSPEDRPRITEALMKGCEQVGYLQPAGQSGAAARLQMMGGEFCGNASMAAAAWLAQEGDSADQGERNLLLEVSGAEGTVSCRVCREREGWRGTVEMPLPREIRSVSLQGRKLQAVFFPGMVHLIPEGESLERQEAEMFLRAAGETLGEPAAGLLQWRTDPPPEKGPGAETDGLPGDAGRGPEELRGEMTPLVWVRDSGTCVWETACGSGTAAVASLESAKRRRGLRVSVRQPGGTLQARTEWEGNRIQRLLLSGSIRLGREQLLILP